MTPTDKITLGSPRFHAFLVAQFLGAANDNAYKITLVLLILATIPDERTQVLYSSLATAFFPIPFLLFSPLAGWLADRFRKHQVLLWTKAPEVAAMTLATLGLWTANLPFLLFALFLMATQSAFFSPAKYGIFPEVFENKDLSMANGILELATNLAILTGSIAGVLVYGWFKPNLVGAGLTYLAIAIAGTLAILFIPRAAPGNPRARFAWNVLASAGSDWAEVRQRPVLFYTLIGIAYFGFVGSVFLTLIPVFGKNVLALAEENSGILLAVLSVGIAAGSLVAGRLSRGHVEIGLVPLGSVGISLFAFDLALNGNGSWQLPLGLPARAGADLLLLGAAAGIFIVPLNSLLQQRSPEGMKGRLIAFSNVLTFTAVLLAAAIPWALSSLLGFSTTQIFLFVAALTVIGTLYVMSLLPDFFVRLVLWLATNTVYRIRVIGEKNIPREGALFVANHVSWVDFLMIGGACDRMIRFLMYRGYYEWPALNWFFRRMGVIPVAAGDPPHKTEQSLAIAREQISQGHVVCIFAEGAITRTGNLLKFKRGFEKIAAGAGCPVVPVYLEGVWGSLFSFEGGKFFFKWPRRLFEPVTVVFGEPMPPTAKAHEVRQRIQELSVEAFRQRKERQRPLHREFIRRARRQWWRPFLVDGDGARLRFGQALVRALALHDKLFAAPDARGEAVGILLPPGVPGALVNIAATMAGRVAVNLDFSEHGRYARLQLREAGAKTVVTSGAFLRRAGVDPASLGGLRVVDLDAVPAAPGLAAWFRGLACALLPSRWSAALFTAAGATDVDQVAAILCSWPTLDAPRGAELTHHNLLSNLESLRQLFHITADDSILGVLPFSNAIGFAATLWLPAIAGARAVYGLGLLDRDDGIGGLVRREKVTLLPANPAVLTKLLERAAAKDLVGLRYVASGGDDLADDLRERFEAKFGIEPLEGYGRAECAPIVSLNVPESGKHRQVGAKPGSTGHPLPGIAVRIVDPATREPLPPGHEGMLWIRGPNVMKGYVNDSRPASDVLLDGWFVTGDHASLDDDGFLTVYYPEP